MAPVNLNGLQTNGQGMCNISAGGYVIFVMGIIVSLNCQNGQMELKLQIHKDEEVESRIKDNELLVQVVGKLNKMARIYPQDGRVEDLKLYEREGNVVVVRGPAPSDAKCNVICRGGGRGTAIQNLVNSNPRDKGKDKVTKIRGKTGNFQVPSALGEVQIGDDDGIQIGGFNGIHIGGNNSVRFNNGGIRIG